MPPLWTSLDAEQCIRAGFEESTGRFRTDALATVIAGDITVEIQGVYDSILNPDPDNVGLIAGTRTAAPTDADQTVRLSSIENGVVRALDVAVFLSDGSEITTLNPFPVEVQNTVTVQAINLDIRDLIHTQDSVRLGDGVDFLTSTTVGADVGLDVYLLNDVTIAGDVSVTQGTDPWIVAATDFDIRNLVHLTDSVALGDGTNLLTSTTIGSDIGLDVNVINTPLAVTQSGSWTTTNPYSFATTPSITQVARTNTSTTLIAANSSRKGLILHNDTSGTCYVAFAASSTTSLFTFRMTGNETVILNSTPIYTGVLSVIWGSSGSGNMNVTELT